MTYYLHLKLMRSPRLTLHIHRQKEISFAQGGRQSNGINPSYHVMNTSPSHARRRPEYCRFERNEFYSGEVMSIKIKKGPTY
jgi:hypothetical protein